MTPLVKSYAVIAALIMASVLTLIPAQAADTGKDPFASSETLAGQTDFLPIEQAYQLAVNVEPASESHNGRVTLDWVIAPAYYLYWERMAITAHADGQPITLTVEHQPGKLKYDDYFERETEVFYERAALVATPQAAPTTAFTLVVESQGCADAGLCYPPRKEYFKIDMAALTATAIDAPTELSTDAIAIPTGVIDLPADITVPPGTGTATSPQTNTATAPTNEHSLGWALLMALLGGLILNLMPCVFPVLSLKIFAMTGHGDHSPEVRRQSWVYLLGVVLSFVIVAAVMMALRASGESVGWGFQLQEPLFISLLVYLFFILGLSFSGIVHIGGSLMGIGQSLVAGTGYRSAFFTGVLAVIVASPCSVPFMGVAVGYAITRSAAEALLVFAVLGVGMALPFLLLSYWPQMLRRLPAPGAWMDRLKQFLAFPLYLTCLWLLYVLGEQGGHMAILWVLGGLILLVMAGWLWRDADAHPSEKLLAVFVLLCALVLPHFLVVQSCAVGGTLAPVNVDGEAEPYSAQRLVELRMEGKPVFINLTAAWCLTCLVNEKVALNRDSVKTHLQTNGIAYLKGDWTNRDPAITKLLQQFDRSGVPLYLYFPAGKGSEIVVLPQVLTEATVLEALR